MGMVEYLDIRGLHLYNSLRFRNSRNHHQNPSSRTKEYRVSVDEIVRLVLIDVGEHPDLTNLKIHYYFHYQK
jgi:hypothetical protein